MPAPLRSTLLSSLLVLAGAAAPLRAAPASASALPEGWFEWPVVEPADGTAIDVSGLNAARGQQLPRIGVADGHFVAAGQRIRFWGCNLAGREAFPATPAAAEAIARQLAKGGVNMARLHHLDNPWGVANHESIWPADRPEHRELDAGQLDRLHRLIAALRDRGIYSNLNLKVSKTLVPADGFPESINEVKDFQKRVDIFDRRMIELQKDYARRILTTRNPYTGFAPAEDPAIAVIELNNENSVMGFWTRDLGRGLDRLPAPFRDSLQAQWNAWLARHYADDSALARAWAPAPTADTASLLRPDAAWKLSTSAGAAGALAPGASPAGLRITVERTVGIDWHVQASTGGITIADGNVYTIEFSARADRARKLAVGVGIDRDARPQDLWRSFGLLDTVELTGDWKTFRLSFPAHSVADAPATLSFNAAQTTGTVDIKDLRLIPDAPGAGLQAGQSLAAKSVPIPTVPSARQWRDWIHFLADTERQFAEEMRAYLRDELHVQAPIACSQVDYGGLTGLNRERAMEWADVHAYWQHPDFGGTGMWDPESWTIRNSPQLAEFAERTFGELGNLALVRVAGKPFTLSEYDHPAPTDFAAEMYPTVASFAARQDWDIVYTFSIGAYGANNPDGRITDFFDQLHHPAKWGQSPFAATLFRRGLVPAAPRARELHLGSPLWAEQPHADILWRKLLPEGSLDFLNTRYAVSDRPGVEGARATLREQVGPGAGTAPVRLVDGERGRLFLINTEAAAGVVGYVGGTSAAAGALQVKADRFAGDFASVTAVALDGKALPASARVLVTVVGRAGNQGVEWNATRTSLGKTWGHGPTIAQRVPATLTLAGRPSRTVYALAPDGRRANQVASRGTGDAITFQVGPTDQTLHYEVVAP